MSRPWMHARPRKHYIRREIAEAAAFLLTLVLVVAAMSADFQ